MLLGNKIARSLAALTLAGAAALGCAASAAADDFYKGKVVTVLVGVGPGTPVDLQMRLMAQYIGRHIPGNPTVIPQNMPGAGGLVMVNYLYNVAPQDGTFLGLMQNTLALSQVMASEAVHYDARKFGWLGVPITPRNHAILVASKDAQVQSFQDAQRLPLVAGASAKGSNEYTVAAILNEFLGTKIRIVTGYPSVAAIYGAIEQKEVQAVGTSWEELRIEHPDFVKDRKINILIQNGPRAAELPDVPTFQELARNDDDREVMALLLSGQTIGRPFALAPRAPAERQEIMRNAFAETLKDPDFVRDAARLKIEIHPISGVDIQSNIASVLDTPARLIPRAKSILE